jgi:outer membrane protein OmpA-like peptidoglycan-associated protein
MRYGFLLHALFLVLWSSPHTVFAQEQDTIRVFFDTDVDETFNPAVLDAFWADRKNDESEIQAVRVIGHADVRGSSAYNEALAQRRAEAVANYIRTTLNGPSPEEVASRGEEDGVQTKADAVLAKQRRVDVVVTWLDPMPSLEPIVEEPLVESPEEDVIEIDTISKDNVVLEGLSFIPGRHYPTPQSMPILFKLVNTMKKYDELEIEIQGHICCSYDAEDGMDNDTGEPFLSRNRAEFVYEFLIESGIDSDRMSYKGLGSTQPKVYPEETDADRQANRRVEIKVK